MPAWRSLGLSAVSAAMRRLRIRPRRGRRWLHSPNLAYREKPAWVARARQLARDHPAATAVLSGDEFSLHRQPTLARVYAPAGEEPRAPLSHRADTRRRTAGVVDAPSGRVVWTAGAKVGTAALVRLLRAIRAAYPTQAVFLVWDNWPVHQQPTVLVEAAALGIPLLWLPTYAPWTNPIAKLWRWLRQTWCHHYRLADRWEEFKQNAAAFLNQFAHGSTDLLRYVGLLPE